jgi:hypothetical protein
MRKFLFIIPMALLSGCGGYDGPDAEQAVRGVEVTDNVPFAHETIQDIIDREKECPLPPQSDRVIPRRHR